MAEAVPEAAHRPSSGAGSPGPVGASESRSLILADAHVHLYDCHDLSLILCAAHRNFDAQSSRVGQGASLVGLLLLTESEKYDGFDHIRELGLRGEPLQGGADRSWRFQLTQEPDSVVATRGDARVVVIAGRQLVTDERLEVLALALSERIPDGLSLAEAVRRTREKEGIPVIPWGAGKWLGHRGAILTRFLHDDPGPDLYLGDNSGRPVFWRRPRHFRLAERLGLRILPGSDPLPLGSEGSRAGAFGFWTPGAISLDSPARDLRRMLRDPAFRPRPYGSLESPLRFLRNQLALRLRRGG